MEREHRGRAFGVGLGACLIKGPRRGESPLFSRWCFSPDSRIRHVHTCWEDRRSRRWPTCGHRKGSRLQGMGQEAGGAGPSNGYQGNIMTCQLAHEGAATGLGYQGRVRAQPQGTGPCGAGNVVTSKARAWVLFALLTLAVGVLEQWPGRWAPRAAPLIPFPWLVARENVLVTGSQR